MLDYARERIHAFLREVDRVDESEFPYEHSKLALGEIRVKLGEHLRCLDLLSASDDEGTVRAACTAGLTAISEYLPFVGFILRSTNVRNAFEVYSPLLRLARAILGDQTRLVLSSEWDYSPFAYVDVPSLESYVLIGLPATESGNPMLIPLAGHELGHSVWRRNRLREDFDARVWKEVFAFFQSRPEGFKEIVPGIDKQKLDQANLFVQRKLAPAYEWTMRQAEESFCDFAGLRLFSEAYLCAFAYLLSPSFDLARIPSYPNHKTRVDNLKIAATKLKVQWPEGFEQLFDDLPPWTDPDPATTKLIEAADSITATMIGDLVDRVVATPALDGRYAASHAGSLESQEDIVRMIEQWVVPARNPQSLCAILNAAWQAFQNKNLCNSLADCSDFRW